MSRTATSLKVLIISFLILLCASQALSVSAGANVWTSSGSEGGRINALTKESFHTSTNLGESPEDTFQALLASVPRSKRVGMPGSGYRVYLPLTLKASPPTEVFKLGILGPFSGPSTGAGAEFKGSVNMAFDAIKWQVCQYKIEPVWIDEQSDPARTSQAYEQAIVQDKIQAGILNWYSSAAVSVMEQNAEYKIPHLFGLGASQVVNEKFKSDPKYGYWMFKGWPTPTKLSMPYIQALEDAIAEGDWTPAEKTVAIYGDDTAGSRSFGGAIKKYFEENGWQTVDEEYFDIAETNFSPYFNRLKALNPAVIAGTSYFARMMSAYIKQADEAGLKSLIIVDGLGWISGWYDLMGKSSNYVLDQKPLWVTDAGKQYANDFEKRWGFAPSPYAAGLAYDGANLFIALAQDICKQNNKLTSDLIYQFVKDNVWTGKWAYTKGIMMSNYSATPDTIPDPVVGKGYYIFPVLQYFDGEGKIVYPPEWAVQKLQVKP